jgi:hypothetical protein
MKRKGPLTDFCLSVSMPEMLARALAVAAERHATTKAGYVRAAVIEQLKRNGEEMEMRSGKAVDISSSAALP